MAELRGDVLRGHLEGMALAVLAAGEAHGYEVLQRLERAGCGELRLKEGTLYPVLYRLEEDGCLSARWEEDGAGRRGPRRRIYRITTRGKRRLAEDRQGWQRFVAVVGRILEVGT